MTKLKNCHNSYVKKLKIHVINNYSKPLYNKTIFVMIIIYN